MPLWEFILQAHRPCLTCNSGKQSSTWNKGVGQEREVIILYKSAVFVSIPFGSFILQICRNIFIEILYLYLDWIGEKEKKKHSLDLCRWFVFAFSLAPVRDPPLPLADSIHLNPDDLVKPDINRFLAWLLAPKWRSPWIHLKRRCCIRSKEALYVKQ